MRLSIAEKKLIRTATIYFFVQIIAIIFFIRALDISQPVDINKTKQIDVIVEDTYRFYFFSENHFVICSNSIEYTFSTTGWRGGYSVSELSEKINIGDKLSLIYFEEYSLSGKKKIIVDARSASETYRTLADYNKSKGGMPLFVIVLFSAIEFVLCGILFCYIWLNKTIIKEFRRKIRQKRKTNRRQSFD